MNVTIEYVDPGEPCGIFNLTNHYVCKLGAACYRTAGMTTRCLVVTKNEGDTCRIGYNDCLFRYPCVRNEYEIMTCNGITRWMGTPACILENTTQTIHSVGTNTNYLAGGVFLILIWAVCVAFLHVRQKQQQLYMGLSETKRQQQHTHTHTHHHHGKQRH